MCFGKAYNWQHVLCSDKVSRRYIWRTVVSQSDDWPIWHCILLVDGKILHVRWLACLHKPGLNHTLGFANSNCTALGTPVGKTCIKPSNLPVSQNGVSEYPYKVRELIKELAFAHCCNSWVIRAFFATFSLSRTNCIWHHAPFYGIKRQFTATATLHTAKGNLMKRSATTNFKLFIYVHLVTQTGKITVLRWVVNEWNCLAWTSLVNIFKIPACQAARSLHASYKSFRSPEISH